MTNFEKVGLFMTTFGQEVKKKPSLSSDKINKLRVNLIETLLEWPLVIGGAPQTQNLII